MFRDEVISGLDDTLFLQEDGSLNDRFNQVAANSVPETLDFQFPSVSKFDVVIQRSETETAKDIDVYVFLIEVDENGNSVRFIHEQEQRGSILTGDFSKTLEITTSFFDSSSSYVVQFGCGGPVPLHSNCENLVEDVFIGQDGLPRFSFDSAASSPILGSELETLLQTPLELQEGRLINFSIARPDDDPAPQFSFRSQVSVDLLDQNSNVVDTQLLQPFILPGLVPTQRSFAVANPPENGSYRITLGCALDFIDPCSTFVQNNVAYTLLLSPDSLPDPINLQYILAFNPDRFEEDNLPATAKPVGANDHQTRSLHIEGDEDWIRFSVEEAAEVNLITTSLSQEASPLELTLFDAGLNLIATDQDSLSEAEVNDSRQRSIDLSSLEVGEYFLRVRGISSITTLESYALLLLGVVPIDDELCFPVRLSSSRVALICL